MAFWLEVIFDGVCALVPDKPLFKDKGGTYQSGDTTRLTMLLPDLKTIALADWELAKPGKPASHREVHWPILELSTDNLAVGSTRALDLEIGGHGLLLLQREFAVFDLVASKLSCNLTVPADPFKITANDQASLWWVPRLKEIAPTAAMFDPKHGPTGTSLPGDIAFGVTLASGHMEVSGHNRDDYGHIQTWDFGTVERDAQGNFVYSADRTWKRAIGNELRWRQFIAADKIKVDLFDDLDNTSSLVLKPTASNSDVRLRVRNIEPEIAVFGATSQLPVADPPDADFLPFYDLAAGGPHSKKPVPISHSGPTGPIKSPCSPGAYEG